MALIYGEEVEVEKVDSPWADTGDDREVIHWGGGWAVGLPDGTNGRIKPGDKVTIFWRAKTMLGQPKGIILPDSSVIYYSHP